MKKNTILIILAIVVVAVVAWYWIRYSYPPYYSPTANVPVSGIDDTTQSIKNDLNSVDLGNLENEFQSIDSDLKTL